MKFKNGVTMLVLVITIVVLLILAGVTLYFAVGENGLLNRTKGASLKSKEDVALEDVGEAWASLDSDYWEALTNNALVSRGEYFNEESLNKLLKGKGKVTNLNYNENGESGLDYTTDDGNKTYSMVVDENGEIRLGKANFSNNPENSGDLIYARLLSNEGDTFELQLSGNNEFSGNYSSLNVVKNFGNIGDNSYKLSKLSSLSIEQNSLFENLGTISKNYYGLYNRPDEKTSEEANEPVELEYYRPLDSRYTITNKDKSEDKSDEESSKKGKLPWSEYVESITKVTIVNEIKPGNTDNWFLGMKNLINIEGLEKLDTSEAVSMKGMFEGCEEIAQLDLSNFETSKVENMSSMFRNTRKLQTLNLTSFDTSKVKDMSYMFYNCSYNGDMNVLDLTSFDTSSVTSEGIDGMFCESGKRKNKMATCGQTSIIVGERLDFE